MAFCTNCGANVAGAFCNQCGTAVRAAAAQPAEQPIAPMPPVAPPPVKRRTSPIVWVLIVVLGFFIIVAIGIAGAGFFVFQKVKQAGVDPELFQSNPGLAITRMLTAINPELDVVRTDDGSGTITIRERKTGKEVTVTFDQAKSGKISFSAEDDQGKTATIDIAGASSKLPSWVPAYPGARIQANISARGNSPDDFGEGGNFSYTTQDSPTQVMSFYQDKAKELEMKVNLNASSSAGGTLVMANDDTKRSLTIVASGASSPTTVNVTYARKH
jgi:hypothetical protein